MIYLTIDALDVVGKMELQILASFEEFSDLINEIQGRPVFEENEDNEVQIPKFDLEMLKQSSIAANVVLGNLIGAAAGYAGAYAATGAALSVAYSTVAAGGVALTDTAAVSTAMLATIGGGEALTGALLLEGLSWGVGFLLAGFVIDKTGKNLKENAQEAYKQAMKSAEQSKLIVKRLNEIKMAVNKFRLSLKKVEKKYDEHLTKLRNIVSQKNIWNEFTQEEKLVTENCVRLVGLLYKMCQTQLIVDNGDRNIVNHKDIDSVCGDAIKVLNN